MVVIDFMAARLRLQKNKKANIQRPSPAFEIQYTAFREILEYALRPEVQKQDVVNYCLEQCDILAAMKKV